MEKDICREVINDLEVVKKAKLQDSPFSEMLAMYDSGDTDLTYWSRVAQSALALFVTHGELPELKLTPDTRLNSEILAYFLRVWVQKLRNEVFGADGRPFEGYEEALGWLRLQSAEVKEIKGRKLSSQGSLSRLIPGQLLLPPNLGGQDEGYYKLRFNKDSIAYKFIQRINEAAGVIRAETLSLVLYILLDAKPLLLPYEIYNKQGAYNMPADGGGFYELRKDTITIDIYSDMTFSEWKQLYGRLKKNFGTERGKNTENRHVELYRLVEQTGFPPKTEVGWV